VKSPHELDIDWFEPEIQLLRGCSRNCENLRVTSRLNKVDTSVNTVVDQFEPVDPVFLLEVRVKSGVNVVHNWFPAVCQLIPKARVRGKLTFHRCLRNHRIRGYRPQSTLALHLLLQYLFVRSVPNCEGEEADRH
jgi:hypothetical protein